MIRYLIPVFLVLLPGVLQAQEAVRSAVVQLPDIRSEILDMVERDQEVQMAIIQKAQSGEPLEPSDIARQDSVFQSHIFRAKQILEEYGWPGYDLVGEEGSQGMFLIVQHADMDLTFQKDAYQMLEAAFANGQASGKNVAYLTDRIRMAEGLPQVYGTQFSYDDRACPVAGNIEAVKQVDARREAVGLEPLSEYIASAITLQGKEAMCGTP